MPRQVSIQDIAHAAGVSHTTVSRALRDSPLISAEVREQIQKIAREQGYIPNAVAQSLRGKRTNTVGIIVTTIADPFAGRVVRGIEEVAQRERYNLLLSVSHNDPAEELALIENFHRRRVDGIILTAARLSAADEERLLRRSVPTVLINPQSEDPHHHFTTISVDDSAGMRAGVDHLIQLGHRAIGYIGALNRPWSNRARHEAYRSGLQNAGIDPRPEWVQLALLDHRFHSDDVIDGQGLFPKLLEAGVTAVCCFNDLVASGALLACRSLGVRVPEQISLVGFDDVELAQLVTPPLTTIHQPKLTMGQLAMETLLNMLEGKPVEDQVLGAELTVRSSTAAPGAEHPAPTLPQPRQQPFTLRS